MSTVGRDFEGDPRPLHTPGLPTFGEQRGDETRKSSRTSGKNMREHFRLALIGVFVDEDACGPFGSSRPQIPFPSSDADEAQTVEFDIAVMTGPYVPE